MSTVFISGATGYLGRGLVQALVTAGDDVSALTRRRSIEKLPIGCRPILGDALDAGSFGAAVPAGATYIHLTGVAHPSPAKAAEFRAIDQVSFEASLAAAVAAKARHFIYVSVAHPAPVMRAYIEVRRECEARLVEGGGNATILRPWYILGEGHRWPYGLLPFYLLAELVPGWRASAQRLGLVTHGEMIAALVEAVRSPAKGIRIVDVPAIRAAALASLLVPSPNRRSSALSA